MELYNYKTGIFIGREDAKHEAKRMRDQIDRFFVKFYQDIFLEMIRTGTDADTALKNVAESASQYLDGSKLSIATGRWMRALDESKK